MVIRGLLVAMVTVVGSAHADVDDERASPAADGSTDGGLARARRAVDEVRYDDARRLLVGALTHGGRDPEQLREIYRLSAVTAVVLGEDELAEQYYRRLLALEPDAALADDLAPKFRERFVAAQAYMAAHGRLEARVARRGASLDVTIVRDPLDMVVAVTAIVDGRAIPRIAAAGRTVVVDPPPGRVSSLVLLDEHGNHLLVLPASELETPVVAGVAEQPTAPLPIARRWVTWAIPAAVGAGVGFGFLVDGRLAKGRLDDILANSSGHFFAEAEVERERWKRSTLVSSVAFVAAGVLAVTSAVMFATAPAVAVMPAVGAAQVGITMQGKF
jgi:hypothetical protein